MHVLLAFFFVIINVATFIKIYCKLTYGICKCSKHLVGKVAIVTGANNKIGLETAKDLAERGARVILACKNSVKGTAAQNSIISWTGNTDVYYQYLNLASLASVIAFADYVVRKEKRVDILINNASVYEVDNMKTEDGLLLLMQINHFGPFLLTYLLLNLLKTSSPSRIINVTSTAYQRGAIDFNNLNNEGGIYNQRQLYKNSKMCNVLTTLELARRLEGTGVTANCVHPGYVSSVTPLTGETWTEYLASMLQYFLKTPWEAAQSTIYTAVSPQLEGVSGVFIADCKLTKILNLSQETYVARKLWEESEEFVGIKDELLMLD